MTTKSNSIPKNVQDILDSKSGCNLDIGCGSNKNSNFIGLDILDLPEVDIVWDFNRTPWPLPDECVLRAVASHVLEHILPTYETARLEPLVQLLIKKGIFTQDDADKELGKPSRGFLGFMDELWRVMKPGGQFAFVCPYAESHGMYQDPTHCNFVNETTMLYFDPLDPSGMYQFYRPRPWRVERQFMQHNGLIEVVMSKRPWDDSYGPGKQPVDIIDEFSTKEVRLS